MNDDLQNTAVIDRKLVSSEQEHEVKYFVKSFDYEFPDRSPQELEAACQKAFDELGGSESRAKLEARAREILNR